MERNTDKVEGLGRKRYLLTFSFVPNGTSAIDQTANVGFCIESVTYSATGIYTCQLVANVADLEHVDASLVQATRTQDVEVASFDAATGVIVLHGFARGGTTPEAITAAAGTRVMVTCLAHDRLAL